MWSRAATDDHFSFEVTANFDEDGMKAVDAIGVKYVFQFARELPAEALGFIVGQQPQGVSSRLLLLERPDIERKYWNDALWSPSYFAASCGGAPIGILRQYIEQQKSPNV